MDMTNTDTYKKTGRQSPMDMTNTDTYKKTGRQVTDGHDKHRHI